MISYLSCIYFHFSRFPIDCSLIFQKMAEQKTWSFDSANNGNVDNCIVNWLLCPSESISCLRFCPSTDVFAVTSWDNTVRCYRYDADDLSTVEIIETNKHERAALACCWDSSGKYLFSGGCDNKVNQWHIDGKFRTLGQHKASVKCMEYSKQHNVLVTGSWDGTVKFWDIRCDPMSGRNCYKLNIGAKVYALSCGGHSFVIGLSNKTIQHYDFRKLPNRTSSIPLNSHCKSLTQPHMVRDIDMFPDHSGFIYSLIGGRCFAYFFAENGKDTFSWNCHRLRHPFEAYVTDKYKHRDVYSVNVVRFNRKYGTCVTGGDDGKLHAWDKDNKAKLWNFMEDAQGVVQPITAVDFDRTGDIMGYAVSNGWDKGHDHCNDKLPDIHLQKVTQRQFEPRDS